MPPAERRGCGVQVRADVSHADGLEEARLEHAQLELVPGRAPGAGPADVAADLSVPLGRREHGVELREEALEDLLLGQLRDLVRLVAGHETDSYDRAEDFRGGRVALSGVRDGRRGGGVGREPDLGDEGVRADDVEQVGGPEAVRKGADDLAGGEISTDLSFCCSCCFQCLCKSDR